MIRWLGAAVVIVALMVGALLAKTLIFSGAATPACTFTQTASERETLRLLNVQRTQHGLGKLAFSACLARAARAHSKDMAAHNYFSHDEPGRRTYGERMNALLHSPGINRLEENIATGNGHYGTPAGLVTAWMHSPGHRANILNPAVHRAGEGNVRDPRTFVGIPPGATIATTEFSN